MNTESNLTLVSEIIANDAHSQWIFQQVLAYHQGLRFGELDFPTGRDNSTESQIKVEFTLFHALSLNRNLRDGDGESRGNVAAARA